MLNTLSDLFLLISNDSQKITNKDISNFYYFITKKMPQIEQHYPTILSKSIKSISNLNSPESKKHKCLSEFKSDKNKKQLVFINFQKKIINLFNDLIDYCYNVGIIKLDNKYEKIIKTKIDEKIREKSEKKNKKNNSKFEFNYNKFYQNELYIHKSKKEELRNLLIFYIINGEININIYPNDYVDFFNSINKTNNRLIAEQFMKYIDNIKILYKEIKKNNKNKILNKSNNTNIEMKNKTSGTSNTGIKSFNTDSKCFKLSPRNNEGYERKTYKKKINKKKNINCSIDKCKTKFITSTSNKNPINQYLKINKIPKDIKSLSPDDIIFNDNNDKYDSDDDDDNEINDTIRCETPKIIEEKKVKKINNNSNLKKLLLKDEQSKDENITNKKINKSYNKSTVSGIINNEESTIISNINIKTNNNNYSMNKNDNNIKQKKSIVNKIINQEEKKENYFKSFINEKNIFNSKGKKILTENNNTQITESQKINDKNKNDIINIESRSEKKINIYKDDIFKKILNNKDNIYNITGDKNYNFLNIRTDKNKHKYKELYLCKNLEMHQHFVICNEDKEKKENEKDELDNIGCYII